jgi:hypothetical protein
MTTASDRIAAALEQANLLNKNLLAYIEKRDAKIEELHKLIMQRDLCSLIQRAEVLLPSARDAWLDAIGASTEVRLAIRTWWTFLDENKVALAKEHVASEDRRWGLRELAKKLADTEAGEMLEKVAATEKKTEE